MGFIKTEEEIKKILTLDQKYYLAEIYFCFWQINNILYKQLIPTPLESDDDCPIFVFFANYPRNEAFGPYKECALFAGVKYKERYGLYCLSMPIDNDMAMIAGREMLGFPKKIAQIKINKENDEIIASVERNSIQFVKIKYDFREKYKNEKALVLQNRYYKKDSIIFFNFHNFPNIDGTNHFHLIQVKMIGKLHAYKPGNAQIEFISSKYDPWIDLKGGEPLGSFYIRTSLELRQPNIFQEVNLIKHAPFAFIGWDW